MRQKGCRQSGSRKMHWRIFLDEESIERRVKCGKRRRERKAVKREERKI